MIVRRRSERQVVVYPIADRNESGKPADQLGVLVKVGDGQRRPAAPRGLVAAGKREELMAACGALLGALCRLPS